MELFGGNKNIFILASENCRFYMLIINSNDCLTKRYKGPSNSVLIYDIILIIYDITPAPT